MEFVYKIYSYANEFLPLCQILFFFFLNEDALTRTVFFHENVLEKKIKKFIQRCYKERSYYNPWQNYFREKKIVLQPAKLICQLLHKKAGISLMENVSFHG